MDGGPELRPSLARVLALNRTVAVVLLAVLFFGLGEQLWSPFLPEYLKVRAEPGPAGWSALFLVGLYACLRNLFEGFCYIGGGQLTARLGDRGSLMLVGTLTVSGYVVFLAFSSPAAAVVAALLILGWEPLSVPVTFTTVGATVSEGGRGMAFALQSIQKRLPKIIGPAVAGFVVGAAARAAGSEAAGVEAGTRALVGTALVLGLVSLAIQWRWMPHRKAPPPGPPARDIVRGFSPLLRRLLLVEVFTRWCDWLVREFVVLYVLAVRGASPEAFGLLVAAQNLTALATYLPIGRMTRTVGLQPFIGVTFVFFALFPLTLAVVPDDWLLLAFVVNGLRETGEPARKALITSQMPETVRARGVGLYWGLRSFALCSASLVGAVLWDQFGPQWLLFAAFGIGAVGAAVYYMLCRGLPEKTT